MSNKWLYEKDMAAVVVQYLKDKGYTIYPEIQNIDIVATKKDEKCKNNLEIIAVECKLSLNLKLIRQGLGNQHKTDKSYIACPTGRSHETRDNIWCVTSICRQMGLGLMTVSPPSARKESVVSIIVDPDKSKNRNSNIERSLDDRAIDYCEAGTPGGGGWTPFKGTVENLEKYVAENPGCDLKDAVAAIEHHYKTKNSAKSSLAKMISKNIIKNITIRESKLYIIERN